MKKPAEWRAISQFAAMLSGTFYKHSCFLLINTPKFSGFARPNDLLDLIIGHPPRSVRSMALSSVHHQLNLLIAGQWCGAHFISPKHTQL
jgi:hypothetical protein